MMKDLKWWQKDKDGWPIEYIKGRSKTYRVIRYIVQNLRKII